MPAPFNPLSPPFNKFNYLPFDGSGNPSSVHEICGVGLPAAEHLRLTAGPGWRVCSMKLYRRTGGASGGWDKVARGHINILTISWSNLRGIIVLEIGNKMV